MKILDNFKLTSLYFGSLINRPGVTRAVLQASSLLMFLSGNLLAIRQDYWFFPKNSALNIGTYFVFLQRYLYSPYKLRGTWLRFCVCFKDMVVERSKYPENLSQFVTLLS